jgi:hypothetical protein
MQPTELNEFARAYVECALWSTNDESDESGGEPFDRNYSAADIAPATLARMAEDCRDFQAKHSADIERAELADSRAGFCFWLNRNGHGSGFWDEYSQTTCDDYEREQATAVSTRDFSKRDRLNDTCGCKYHVCQRLSRASKEYGTFDLYIGDDKKIHGS